MKSISLTRYLFILLFSFSSLLYANPFSEPYQGQVVVEKQSEAQLQALALKQVLVKVSGNINIDKLDETQLLKKRINSLLAQYGYQEYNHTRYFVALFDKSKINQALKEMQQPIWADTRPTTLLWLIEDDNSGRRLISDDIANHGNGSQLAMTLQQQQRDRGVDLQFPLLDLEDNLALSISDIAGRFYKPIAQATQRYDVNHFVVANLKQISAEKWSLRWELLQFDPATLQAKRLIKKTKFAEKSALLTSMVNEIADYYVSQYAVLENQGEKFSETIYVAGVDSLAELVKLNKLLTDLLAVASYEVVSVEGALVTVDIKINGGLVSFKNALSVQPHLQADLSKNQEMYFNWR